MKKFLFLIPAILLFSLFSACANNEPAPNSTNDAHMVETIVAGTLSAIPSNTDTSIPSLTPTVIVPSEPLNRSDFLSVVKWVSFSIIQNQPELFADLVGQRGVSVGRYRSAFNFFGSNNSEFFVTELGKGLINTSPQCLGYSLTTGTPPDSDKGEIIYKDINFDWTQFGLEKIESVHINSFFFMKFDERWELVVIVPIPDDAWNELSSTITQCP